MFTVDIQPRFTDYDMFGHVNNTVLLQYLDLGKALFFNSITAQHSTCDVNGNISTG